MGLMSDRQTAESTPLACTARSRHHRIYRKIRDGLIPPRCRYAPPQYRCSWWLPCSLAACRHDAQPKWIPRERSDLKDLPYAFRPLAKQPGFSDASMRPLSRWRTVK